MTKEQADYVYITRFPDQLYLSVICPLCTVLNADWIGKWDGSNTAIKTTVILSISVQLSKKSIVAISFFDQICAKYHICSLVMQTTNSHHRIFTARSCISMSISAKIYPALSRSNSCTSEYICNNKKCAKPDIILAIHLQQVLKELFYFLFYVTIY